MLASVSGCSGPSLAGRVARACSSSTIALPRLPQAQHSERPNLFCMARHRPAGRSSDSPSSLRDRLVQLLRQQLACNGSIRLGDFLRVQVLEDRAEDLVGLLDLRQPLLACQLCACSAAAGLLGLGLLRLRIELGQALAFGPLGLRPLRFQGVLFRDPCGSLGIVARTACQVLTATPATSSRAIAAAVVKAARCFRANFRSR